MREALRQLEAEGIPAFDPYAIRPAKKAQPNNLVDVVSAVVNDLDRVEGLDVTVFFENLGALALAAGRRTEAAQHSGELDELKAKCRSQQAELCAQRERFNALLGLHRQLISVNREFLGLTGVTKMSALSGYIHELSQNVEDCEKLLREY